MRQQCIPQDTLYTKQYTVGFIWKRLNCDLSIRTKYEEYSLRVGGENRITTYDCYFLLQNQLLFMCNLIRFSQKQLPRKMKLRVVTYSARAIFSGSRFCGDYSNDIV